MRLFLILISLILTSCQKAPEPQEKSEDETVLELFLDLNARLEMTAYPILRENISDCGQIDFSTGFFVHTVQDFPTNLRALVREKLQIGDMPHIRLVLPGSPAATAGLKPGDKVLGINDIEMTSDEQARAFFETVSRAEFSKGSGTVKVERQGKILDVGLSTEKICGYPAQLFFSEDINAYTNGDEIWVTSELVNRVKSEESLALIVAHELAHATQGHIFKEASKAFELEADRIGMTYLVRAGYDGSLALAEWTANPLNHKSQIRDSHPTFDERWRALDGALREAQKP